MAVVLIISADGELPDRVAAELAAGAYALQRVPSAKAALAAVARTSPDAIVIVAELASRDARLAALRAGASDIFDEPLDVTEMLIKLDSYAQLKTLAEQ